MNPASRLHRFVAKTQTHTNKNQPLFEVYKSIFNVDNVFDIFKALSLLQEDSKKLTSLFIATAKEQRYSDVINLLQKLTAPTNLEVHAGSITSSLDIIEPKLLVLSDALQSTHLEESDIEDELKPIQQELDDFLSKIKNLDIDSSTKAIYASVTYKLKQSIEFYSIGGKSLLQESLQVFRCVTDGVKEAEGVVKKLSAAIEKAKSVKDIVGFIVENTTKLIGN